jgi:hypothetical protein
MPRVFLTECVVGRELASCLLGGRVEEQPTAVAQEASSCATAFASRGGQQIAAWRDTTGEEVVNPVASTCPVGSG